MNSATCPADRCLADPQRPHEETAARCTLAFEMSEISEEGLCAYWLIDLEHLLWEAVEGRLKSARATFSRDGDYPTDKEIASLRRLSDLAGGWVYWDDTAKDAIDWGERFIPLPEWRERHAAWLARREARL